MSMFGCCSWECVLASKCYHQLHYWLSRICPVYVCMYVVPVIFFSLEEMPYKFEALQLTSRQNFNTQKVIWVPWKSCTAPWGDGRGRGTPRQARETSARWCRKNERWIRLDSLASSVSPLIRSTPRSPGPIEETSSEVKATPIFFN